MSKPAKEMDLYDFHREVNELYEHREHKARVLIRVNGVNAAHHVIGSVEYDEDGDLIISAAWEV